MYTQRSCEPSWMTICAWLVTQKNAKPYGWRLPSTSKIMSYCQIIFIRWTFNFVFLVGRAIHEIKIPTKLLFTLVIQLKLETSKSHGSIFRLLRCHFQSPKLFCYIFNVNKIACLDIQSFDIFSHSISIPGHNTTFRTLRLMARSQFRGCPSRRCEKQSE